MAFVFRADRGENESNKSPLLGPGHYMGPATKTIESGYAPFLSKGIRKTEGNINPTPGPGAYSNKPTFSSLGQDWS